MPEVPRLEEPLVALRDQLLAYARDLRVALADSRAATEELSRTQLETVAALAAAIDVRDEVTGGHVYRVANYGLVLAEQLAPPLASDPQLVYGFLLHDIGKLGVPDRVLLKKGPLDPDERALMRAHVEHGVRFVQQVTFLRPALEVVATHHEAWDGSGYPRGLKGEEIPFVTRLFTVCDAFDAMVHDRPYRKAMPPEAALAELRRTAGAQFDPVVVASFEEVAERLIAVGERPLLDVTPRTSRRRRRGLDHDGSLVFDAMDDAMLLVTPDGIVSDANLAFLALFGLTRPPVGMTIAELTERLADTMTPEPPDEHDLSRHLLAPNSEVLFEVSHPAPRLVRRVSHMLYGDGGAVVGRLLLFKDVRGDRGAT
ncbi:MAG: HD domain-containing protein [Actinomycetota bacterium]|nr:HD domain-containing protein [Actinomycetota bacterium]